MMVQGKIIDNEKRTSFYKDSHEHLADELKKLDLLIQQRVIAFHQKIQTMQKTAASYPRYISNEEIDWLLNQNGHFVTDCSEVLEICRQLEVLQEKINVKISESMNQRVLLALQQLAHLVGLSPFELQTVIICLAPELDRKYDKLYAYLQDDITRKKPSVDLVLDLLCETKTERWKSRTFFTDASPLFRARILHKTDDPQSPSGSSGLSQFLKLDPRILNYLLGNNNIDGRLLGLVKLLHPLQSVENVLVDPQLKKRVLSFIQHHFSAKNSNRKRLVFNFHGPYGAGKHDLARGICGQLNCLMIYLDMELLLTHESDFAAMLDLIFREGLLLQAALYLDNVDVLLKEDDKAKAFIKELANAISEYGWLTFLAGERPWPHKKIFEQALFYNFELSVPDISIRKIAWEKALKSIGTEAETTWPGQLASRFRLTPGQIRDAVEFADKQRSMIDGHQKMTITDIFNACRNQSNQKLGELALKIEPRYKWEDLVLPEDKLLQLNEICSQVKHYYKVFGEWGFDQKLSHGKGLSLLFFGPPGTGKTMAVEVIANELKLDLYKIDLSGVVSKYIGETEKNLSKIFKEAETSNAILFFDEADALFGKRTEVSDAHDRYANIETSFLLQKMEEYEGVVILATNLRNNMDDAFTRRIRFIVEFPFPDEASRLKIWKTHFPKEAPLSNAIDYEFLSRKFQIAGGNIKNIVLNAAFMAAENGGIIGMEHVLHGAKREFEKIGKLWSEKDLNKSLSSKNGGQP